MFDLEINHGTLVWHDKIKSSGKEWAHLTKLEVLGMVDFWQFYKNCPTSTMHNFFNFELLEVFLDFLEILRCHLTNPFGLIAFGYSMLKL